MIKHTFLAFISLILFGACIYYFIDRITFLNKAQHTKGTVSKISSYNSNCGSGRRRSRHPCTKFNADVLFSALNDNRQYSLNLSAGSCRGHNQPDTCADFRAGQRVDLVYDPENPAIAYQDSFWGVWAVPIILLFSQIGTMIGSITGMGNKNY